MFIFTNIYATCLLNEMRLPKFGLRAGWSLFVVAILKSRPPLVSVDEPKFRGRPLVLWLTIDVPAPTWTPPGPGLGRRLRANHPLERHSVLNVKKT